MLNSLLLSIAMVTGAGLVGLLTLWLWSFFWLGAAFALVVEIVFSVVCLVVYWAFDQLADWRIS
jgi:hypothetical protein